MKQNKWSREYWRDLGERIGASAVGGALTMITADSTGVADYSPRAWWVLVGIPAAVSALKGLLVNLKGDEPSASLADVSSY
jgi:hypothetical protein